MARKSQATLKGNVLALVHWGLVLLACLVNEVQSTGANKCPPPENIMPCRCRGRNDQVQVWCSHSDLERVNGALENLMRLRSMPAIDELIVENNKMPTLPARAFGALQIGRLLLRNNGLESLSRNAFAGLEDSLEEIYIVEDKLVDFPFDAIENLRNLEAFTIEKSKIRLLPRFNGLNRLKHIRIDGSLIAGFPVGAFASMGSIKQIHVVNSQVERLAEGIFGRLDSLLLANFSGNRIDHIQRRCFALLPRLEVLALGNNRLSDATTVGRSMEELSGLKSLDISSNLFKELPEGSFVNLRSLQLLNLAGNEISRVHTRSFTHLPALRKVDLSRNMLRNFPRMFFDTTPLLEELRMRRNLLGTANEVGEMLSSLKSLKYLDLGENGLMDLPTGAIRDHTHLQTLDLSDNKITRIQRQAFQNVPSLQEMSLKNNSLKELPTDGEAWNIPSLKELDLSMNSLNELTSNTLRGLLRLARIDLSHNSIKTLGSGSFGSNKDLEFLDVSSNGMQTLSSEALVGLTKLNKLDLGKNHLENLQPGSFRDLKTLQTINLGNNRINNVPANLFTETRMLEDLNFKSNSISFIPHGFFQSLGLLKELNLKHNNLGEINSMVFAGLQNLETLRLSSNQISRFDDSAFDNLKKLRGLDLSSNRISKLPSRSFKNLPMLERFEARENRIGIVEKGLLSDSPNLQIIDLAHNGLSEIPDVIKDSLNIKVIDLSHNQIANIDANTFTKLSGLMELYLNDNKIKGLKSGTLEGLSSLTIVDLDGNEVEQIPQGAFRNLPRLIYLRMSRNKIKRIERSAFSNLNSLDGLDLQENDIEEISPGGFEKTGALKYLNLSHNNLDSMNRMGLLSLGSLEVLDFSFNRLSDVDAESLKHLIWLVELRMNDNGICGIPTGTFDGMSRLKMLVLRNNRLKHLYESVFYKLRNNIAFLDVSGNPLECDCEMTWLRNLMAREELQELTESTCDSPADMKGTLVKQARPGRMICTSSKRGYGSHHHLQSNELESCPPLTQSKRRPRPASVEPEDRPLFGTDVPHDERYYGGEAGLNNELKNRRKDEKLLLESNDYVAGDTPTIYAGSSINSHTKATTLDAKKSNNGGSVLSSLFGIPIDFGFNFGISPAFSWTDKKSQTASRNSNPKHDPLPPSWIERPSKGHSQAGNVYEAPEYIPRRPQQPYIPLNPLSDNTPPVLPSGSIVDVHKTRAPKPSSGVKFPEDDARSQSGSSNKPKTSWHPDYHYQPNTETGFIPIEPFFHNKNQNPKKSSSEPARQGLGSSTEKSSSYPITRSPSNKLSQIQLTDPTKITSFVPSSSTDRTEDTSSASASEEDDEPSYTPVEIQTTDKPKGDGSAISNFWDIFTDKDKIKVEQVESEVPAEAPSEISYEDDEPRNPFNFSAPIDSPVDPNKSEKDSEENEEDEEAEYNIPFGEPHNPTRSISKGSGNRNRVHVTGKPTITKIIETELPSFNSNSFQNGGNKANHETDDGQQNETPELTPNVGNYIQDSVDGKPSRYEEIPTDDNEDQVETIDTTSSNHPPQSPLVPPVIIGNRDAEPRDWYYTNYHKGSASGSGSSSERELAKLEKLLRSSSNKHSSEDLVFLNSATTKTIGSLSTPYHHFLLSLLCYFVIR